MLKRKKQGHVKPKQKEYDKETHWVLVEDYKNIFSISYATIFILEYNFLQSNE